MGRLQLGQCGWPTEGVEQAQVVVDLRDGADGGARGAAGGFLLDGDGGREAFDGIDVGALHLVEKLAGVGRKCFDVAALAFRIDGVEGERRFAGTGEAGDDGEGVARDGDGDVAQVVLAGAAHGDVGDTGARLAGCGWLGRERWSGSDVVADGVSSAELMRV